MKENIGIAGWNEGFKVAKGEYVLVLDDDAYPDKNALLQVVSILFEKNKVGIVAFNIFDKSRNIYETKDFTPPFKDFIGCGALIRRECIEKIGGFDSRYFIYAHETDFSIRTLNEGYLIDYCKDAMVFHRNIIDPNIKPAFSNYRFINQSFSYIKLLKKYLPRKKVRFILLKFLINRFLVALYFNLFSEFYSLIVLIFKNSSDANNSRLEIKNEILELYGFNVELFNRYYFSRLLNNHSKFAYPFLYLKTLFNPLSEKASMLA
jgi:GT2 family glycosyltransferase